MKQKPLKHFKFPKQLLSSINECSKGFFLVVINDRGEFEPYLSADDAVTELAIINYLDINAQMLQQQARNPEDMGPEEQP